MTEKKTLSQEEKLQAALHCIEHGLDYRQSVIRRKKRHYIVTEPRITAKMFYLNQFHTFEELQQAIDKYMDFYNTRRLQSKLKGLASIDFRNQTL